MLSPIHLVVIPNHPGVIHKTFERTVDSVMVTTRRRWRAGWRGAHVPAPDAHETPPTPPDRSRDPALRGLARRQPRYRLRMVAYRSTDPRSPSRAGVLAPH